MNWRTLTAAGWLAIAAGALSTGCATPAPSPTLQEARAAYREAERDPVVASNAAIALKEAQQSLAHAEALWEKGKAEGLVDHHAYVTKQKVAIAQEQAKLRTIEQQVNEAQEQRRALLLQVRTREAELARRRAEAKASEAELARQRAETRAREVELAQLEAKAAAARAKELADQVAELEARQTERGLVLTLGDVLFDFDQADLKPGAERVVSRLTTFLSEYPERKVMIEGFTDSVGPDAYNQNLSQRRAVSIQDALVKQGIGPARIQIRGYGKQYPVASNDNPAGRQRNRRVEIVVSDEQGQIPERTN